MCKGSLPYPRPIAPCCPREAQVAYYEEERERDQKKVAYLLNRLATLERADRVKSDRIEAMKFDTAHHKELLKKQAKALKEKDARVVELEDKIDRLSEVLGS